MTDEFRDRCGVFAVYGHADAVALTARGLAALQHRGQEGAGIAFWRAGSIDAIKAAGTVKDLAPRVRGVAASAAAGHVRYGTCGPATIDHTQPCLSQGRGGRVALCHNGHIVDHDRLRAGLPADDAVTQANDSELLARRVAMHFGGDLARAMQDAFRDVTPAYSVAVLTADSLCAVRDPLGMRPLSIGRKGLATVIASETCAVDAIDATYVRDVHPGELVIAQDGGLRCLPCPGPSGISAHCIFELIYFARPDSVVFGHVVADFRTAMGRRLAREAPAPGDIVVPVPDSALYGALGYAHESGTEPAMALFRDHFVGRSFIEPTAEARTAVVLAKLNPIRSLIAGRRVILIDDSIVRGNTCRHVVRMLRDSGAREVHVRVTSPPTIAACHFGVDTPDDRELFAHGRDRADMARVLGVDSVEFLSLEGLLALVSAKKGFCTSCFTGVYPIDVRCHARSLARASAL